MAKRRAAYEGFSPPGQYGYLAAWQREEAHV